MAEGGVNVGDVYNRLTAIRFNGRDEQGRAQWLWKCECGNENVSDAYRVKNGRAISCGCHRNKLASERLLKHGMTKTKTHYCWLSMISRCHRPGASHYDDYGGRGIKVCDRWRNSFEAFHADMGTAPPGRSIDRINVNGDYEPGNCKWSTQSEQCRNKRNSVYVNVDGVKMPLMDIVDKTGISRATLAFWLNNPAFGEDCVSALAKSDYTWKRPRILILMVTPDDKPEVLLRNIQHVVFKRKEHVLGRQELYIVQETA